MKYPFLQILLLMAMLGLSVGCSTTKSGSKGTQQVLLADAPPQEAAQDKQPAQATHSAYVAENYRPEATKVFDLIHTRLEVRFDWPKAHLLGKAQLTLKPHFYPAQRLTLDAKGFLIHRLERVDGPKKRALAFDYDGSKLQIDLGQAYDRTQRLVIEIDYTARPNELASTQRHGAVSDAKGLFFINPKGEQDLPRQIWTQGETESSSCWFPTIDAPNQKTTQEIYITVEKDFISLSNGKLMSSIANTDGTRTDYWRQDLPHAPYLVMMAVGDFRKVQDHWRNVPVDYYVEPEYEAHARAMFANTTRMLSFYSELFGIDYLWDKYAQIPVRQYVSGAMENTGAVIFGDYIQQTTRELMDENHENVVAHEMVHHWFGDLVTCESWSQLPLNESFATYGEYLWFEHAYGADRANLEFQNTLGGYLNEAKEKKLPLIRHHHGIPDDMFDAHSYNKGAWVLHTLRGVVGDDAFFEALRLYLRQNKFKAAEIEHLRLSFEEVTGRDLKWFFDQWFAQSGHPELLVEHQYHPNQQHLELRVRQVQDLKNAPVYHLPVQVAIYPEKGKPQMHYIEIDSTDQRFWLPATTTPHLVLFAPDGRLLAEVEHPKTDAEYAQQYYRAPGLTQRMEAAEHFANLDSEASRGIMRHMLADSFYYLRYYALANFAISGLDSDSAYCVELSRLAKTDPHPQVRYAALHRMSAMPYDSLLLHTLQHVAMHDSSLLVIDGVLDAARTRSEWSLELARYYEKDPLVAPYLCELYATDGPADKLAFFATAYQQAKGYRKWQVLEQYAKYIVRWDAAFLEQGLGFLIEKARRDDLWWIRGGAAESLVQIYTNLAAREQAEPTKAAPWTAIKTQIRTEISTLAQNETHPRLRLWFAQLVQRL